MNKTSIYSLNTKITLAFITIGFILLAILFVQIIPRLIDTQKKDKKEQLEHMIALTQNQLKFAIELIRNERKRKVANIQQWFEEKSTHTLEQLQNDGFNHLYLQELQQNSRCNIYMLNSLDEVTYNVSNNTFDEDKIASLKENRLIFFTEKQKHMCPKTTRSILYERKLSNNQRLVMECNPSLFKDEHNDYEAQIKKELQKSFELTQSNHKGKINLLWINTLHPYFETQPLYHYNDRMYNERYCLSKMSSATFPQTGKLTAKQIIDASDKEPLLHTIYENDNLKKPKQALTWVRPLNTHGEKQFYFLITVFVEDFNKNIYNPLLKIMPAGVFALITAILLGVIIFRRMFKSIAVLTNTVKEVNAGNRSIRNNLQGDDDIATLAKSFDSMLDSIEENILQLDANVALKTQQLQSSLKEKETLLKEIHHRVKNNLAMTINLIKLQKPKIKDQQSQEVLTDIQERIFTMELLHKKLYESNDLNSIDMPKYIQELVEDLQKTYCMNKEIKTEFEIEAIQMHIEYALPCGLIITECIINSLKYAFKGNHGVIGVKLYEKNSLHHLIIYDSGEGLPSNIDIHKTKTLGLKLITSIVKSQLKGSIECDGFNGTCFEICFKMDEVK